MYVDDCGLEMASNGGGSCCSYVYNSRCRTNKTRLTSVNHDKSSSNIRHIAGKVRGGHKKLKNLYSKQASIVGATETSMGSWAESGRGKKSGFPPMESLACGPKNYTLDVNHTFSDMVQKLNHEEWLATLTFDKIMAKTYSVIESETFDRAMYDSLESMSSVVHNLSQSHISVVKNIGVHCHTSGVDKYFPGYFSDYKNYNHIKTRNTCNVYKD